MKKSNLVVIALLSFMLTSNALAGSISKGQDTRGVTLNYEGFNLGQNGVVRFSLECVKTGVGRPVV